ncbi:Hypothetical_protein [Hexamita inflata]|uniref:Hypothetical_protein n=1 Tax=Hexamita inflata TaxID=28002 RepID=A0AA86P5R8_9EUKA|nr:Hypothetical protein HINF_LOCUS20149 [Hexamita inflata]
MNGVLTALVQQKQETLIQHKKDLESGMKRLRSRQELNEIRTYQVLYNKQVQGIVLQKAKAIVSYNNMRFKLQQSKKNGTLKEKIKSFNGRQTKLMKLNMNMIILHIIK